MDFDVSEKTENNDFEGSKFLEEVYSKAVRAGQRTYFFDVKKTRKNEFYLTITESKKRSETNGSAFYEKHKIFLFKEDFVNFVEGLIEIVDYINVNQPQTDDDVNEESTLCGDFSRVDFEDL